MPHQTSLKLQTPLFFPLTILSLLHKKCLASKKMDRTQRENQHTLTQLTVAQFLKKVTKFLLSISMFSLLFSHTSLLPLLHSYNFYLSTFLYQLFTHTIDKSCMFLLCNGLLVFLAKYSGLVRCLSTSSSYEESYSKIIMDGSQSESTPIMQRIEEFVDKEVVVVESIGSIESASIEEGSSDHEKEKVEDKQAQEQEHEEESGFFVLNQEEEEEAALEQVAEEEEEKKWAKGGFYIEQRGEEEEEEKGFEEEEEEGNGRLSTEELNKKFDDFIRRMKEELRIEAQRHLIMV